MRSTGDWGEGKDSGGCLYIYIYMYIRTHTDDGNRSINNTTMIIFYSFYKLSLSVLAVTRVLIIPIVQIWTLRLRELQ